MVFEFFDKSAELRLTQGHLPLASIGCDLFCDLPNGTLDSSRYWSLLAPRAGRLDSSVRHRSVGE